MKDIRDNHRKAIQPYNPLSSSEPPLDETVIEMFEQQQHSNISSPDDESVVPEPTEPERDQNKKSQPNKAASSRKMAKSVRANTKRATTIRGTQHTNVADNSASSKPRQGKVLLFTLITFIKTQVLHIHQKKLFYSDSHLMRLEFWIVFLNNTVTVCRKTVTI